MDNNIVYINKNSFKNKQIAIVFFIFSIFGVLFLNIPLLLMYIFVFLTIFIKNDFFNKSIIVYLSFIAGLIGSIRIPTEDGVNYILYYNSLQNISFDEITTYFIGDPLFYFISKVLSIISNGDEQFFVFFWSFIFYFNLLYSLFLGYKLKLLNRISFILVSILIISMPAYLLMSTHLVRQFVSSSFLILSIMLYLKNSKLYLITIFMMLLIHISSIIFFAIFFIKSLKERLSYKIILLLIALTLILMNINIFESIFSLMNSIGISFGAKLDGAISGAATIIKHEGDVSVVTYVLSIFTLSILFYKAYIKKFDRYILLFNMMLISFLFFNSLRSVNLLYFRYSWYEYIFIPFGIAILFSYVKNRYFKLAMAIAIILLSMKYIKFFERENYVFPTKKEQLFEKPLHYFFEVKKDGLLK